MSRKSLPIPETGTPSSVKATPISTAASTNARPPSFRNRKCRIWSLATKMSGKQSPSASATLVLMPFPTWAPIPVGPETSVNRPPPSLR